MTLESVTSQPVKDKTVSGANRDRIKRDKILLLVKNIPSILISSILGCLPIAVVSWDTVAHSVVLAWVLVLYLITAARAWHYRQAHLKTASFDEIFRYGKENLIFVSLAGMVWGTAGVLFFDGQMVAGYAFLILTLVGIISGSMNALSSVPPAYAIFAALALAPTIILMALQNTGFFYLMGAAALFYLLMTLLFSRNLNAAIEQSLTLKYENLSLVESLKKQTVVAEKANLDKSTFLASASHDLRQPLHAVNLFTEVLENSGIDGEQKKVLKRIRHGLDTMGELFDTLLDISRIDANTIPINKTNVPLQGLVRNLVDQFQLDISEPDVRLSSSKCDYVVFTDTTILQRILHNLLSNAVRYTQQGEIEVDCSRVDDETIIIHVRDTGVGIDPVDSVKIFEEFVQLNNPERDRSKGLGLGLAIVRRLGELLDHPVSMTSELGSGSQFSIELPLGTEQAITVNATGLELEIRSHLEGITVLVVDNELEIIDAMRMTLESWGCKVIVSNSTAEALQLVAGDSRVDFIISDYRMPSDLNGVEFILAVRAQHGEIPGLLISGDTSKEILDAVSDHGLILLYKPIKSVQLNMAMMQLLEIGRRR